MKNFLYRSVLILLFLCNACLDKSKTPSKTATLPEVNVVPGLDHGLSQSPINILSKEAGKGEHSIILNYSDAPKAVKKLGHSVQLDTESGNTLTIASKTFEFRQVHFHTPSEHFIDGVSYPLEMHVVTTMVGQKEKETPEYVVISLLFKMGEENKFLKEFMKNGPKDENTRNETHLNMLLGGRILQKKSDPLELKGYYNYKGSLTTPPYTESVNWFVAKKVLEAAPEQIQLISSIEVDRARPIQNAPNVTVPNE